jgi:lipopolysaccharide export system protein LptA
MESTLSREKIFRLLAFMLAVLLVILLFRFRPRIEGPEKLEVPSVKAGGVTLSGKNFRHEARESGVVKYIVTADEVLEKNESEKELINPVITIPKEHDRSDRIFGQKGTLAASKQEVRIYENAKIALYDGMTISSSAFRLTSQGEVLSEGPALMERGELKGRGDILRYDRERRVVYLEGNVELRGPDNSFSASRIKIDLDKHTGEIKGPVKFAKESAKLEAPDGEISLDAENRLKSLTLLTPTRGELPSVKFASQFSDYFFDKKGAVNEVVLRGKVSVTRTGEAPTRLETEILSLGKAAGKEWIWSSPEEMFFFRGFEKITAPKGSGTIEGGIITGDLQGPVRGWDESGEFSAGSARINADSFDLIGNAQAVRGKESVKADRIISRKSGEKEAVGNVSGSHNPEKGEPVLFTSDKALMAAKTYPVTLNGNAHVYSSRFEMKGEEAAFLSAKTMSACKGAAVTVEGKGNPVFLYGSQIDYDEEAGKAVAKGDPSATDGKSRLSAAGRIELILDPEKKAEKVSAEDSAFYESEIYKAEGDKIVYFPKTRKGEVSSSNAKARVIEKSPYKMVTGKIIDFGSKELSVRGDEGEVHRGKIEGEDLKGKTDAK